MHEPLSRKGKNTKLCGQACLNVETVPVVHSTDKYPDGSLLVREACGDFRVLSQVGEAARALLHTARHTSAACHAEA